jgi:aspartate dehydrogenase
VTRQDERVVVIGLGAMGLEVVRGLASALPDLLIGVLARRPEASEVVAAVAPRIWVGANPTEALRLNPTLVVECASQVAVSEHLEYFLTAGANALVTSTGALVNPKIRARLLAAARQGEAEIRLSAGAMAGLDGLAALSLSGLDDVRYTSAKPPAAWKGTPAEKALNLDRCDERTVFFDGFADDAASQYPQNANVAATIAFTGIGLDSTRVQLIADPSLRENVGRLRARGAAGALDVQFRGPPSVNPRTSAVTAFAVIREVTDGACATKL